MSALLFSFNAVFPIVILLCIGYFLKRINLFSQDFFKQLNKLTFKVLLPVNLFVSVYEIESISNIDMRAPIFAVSGVFIAFIIGFLATFLVKDRVKKGAVWQCVFRSNYAILGIPLARHLLPGAGGVAAILAAFVVPEFNVLAIICLSIFKKDENKVSIKKIFLDICKNPLILGVISGVVCLGVRALFTKWVISFRLSTFGAVGESSTQGFIYTVIKYLSSATTPVALLAMGGQFEFATYKTDLKEVIIATCLRSLLVPAFALFSACLMGFNSAQIAAFISVFGSPVAVSSAVMAYEMKSDGRLASALVVSTTIISIFTLTATIALLRGLGYI